MLDGVENCEGQSISVQQEMETTAEGTLGLKLLEKKAQGHPVMRTNPPPLRLAERESYVNGN